MMKKCFALALLAIVATPAFSAGDPTPAVNQAHKVGFHGCDSAIKTVFDNLGGDNYRINSAWFPETKGKTLRMTAVYGSKGDSIYSEVLISKNGGECLTTQTTQMVFEKGCPAYMSEVNDNFKFVAESPDHIWLENKGGVNLLLRSIEGSCLATYQLSRTF